MAAASRGRGRSPSTTSHFRLEDLKMSKKATPNTIRVFGAANQATMRSEIDVMGQCKLTNQPRNNRESRRGDDDATPSGLAPTRNELAPHNSRGHAYSMAGRRPRLRSQLHLPLEPCRSCKAMRHISWLTWSS